MVKNTGGKRTKAIARKNMASRSSSLVLADCEEKKYAIVVKLMGGAICSILTEDNVSLMGHIRGKFSGRNKSKNMISTNTLVLIGLRTWESTPKNCDILEVYSHDDIKVLGQIPSIHIDHLIRMANGFSGTGGGGGGGGDSSSSIAVEDIVDFINDVPAVSNIAIIADVSADTEVFELENTTEINIDDI